MVQLSATRCSCVAILCVSIVSFAAITLCVAIQLVFIIVSVYLFIELVRIHPHIFILVNSLVSIIKEAEIVFIISLIFMGPFTSEVIDVIFITTFMAN
jgi:hypothetical protein